ncbi:MAG: lipoprotein [Gallintestinimicrobium sp.]
MDGETSERETIMKYFRKYVLSILLCFILTGCGQQAGFSESVSAVPESNFTESQTGVPETVMQQQTDTDAETAEIKSASDNVRPSKEEVLAMREKTLDGMPETEISRLRENIKVANLQMESAYLNDNLFKSCQIKKAHTGSILTAKATFSWAGGIISRSIRRMSS